MKRLFVAIFAGIFIHGGLIAKNADGHAADILDVLFGGKKSTEARELVDFISQGMDMGSGAKPVDLAEKGSSFLNTVRNDFGGSLKNMGKHRELGHWALDGAIPKEYLQEIDELVKEGKLPPNAREILIGRWREFVSTRTEAVKQVFGLAGEGSDRVARAFASMADDIHNLSDYLTKDPTGLQSLDDISKNFQRSLRRILGKNNNLSKALAEDLAKIPKTLPPEIRAQRMLEVMKKYGPEISNRFRSIFGRYGFSGTLKKINYARLKDFLKEFRRKLAIGSQSLKQVKNVGFQKGYAVDVVSKDGKTVRVIRQPVVVKNGKMIDASDYVRSSKKAAAEVEKILGSSAKGLAKVSGKGTVKAAIVKSAPEAAKNVNVKGAAKLAKFLESSKGQGAMAGVVSFVISEGSAIVDFSSGDIAQDQFFRKTAFNAGKATVEGFATYGIAVMLAGAPAGIMVGAMIGAGILIEKGGDYVWVEIEKEYGTLPGVTDDELLYTLPACVRNRHLWVESLDEKEMEKQRSNNRKVFDDDAPTDFEKVGQSFY